MNLSSYIITGAVDGNKVNLAYTADPESSIGHVAAEAAAVIVQDRDDLLVRNKQLEDELFDAKDANQALTKELAATRIPVSAVAGKATSVQVPAALQPTPKST